MLQFFPSDANVAATVQGFNRNLTDTDIAQIKAREAAAAIQAQAQQAQQQRFFQQQQNQQQNDLQRQQLTNQDFFNRGRLTNEGKSLDAQIAQGQVALSEAEKDRQLKRDLGLVAHPAMDWRDQQLLAQQNEIADAANNHAAALNQKDALDAAQAQIDKADQSAKNYSPVRNFFTRSMIASPVAGVVDYLGNDSARQKSVLDQIPKQIGTSAVAVNPNVDIAANIKSAKDVLEVKKADLSKMLSAGSQAGLDSHVTRGPDGKWTATVKPITGLPAGTNSFFRPSVPVVSPTATVTNTPSGFFNPAPIISPAAAPVPIIKFDPVSGRPIAYDPITKNAIGYAN